MRTTNSYHQGKKGSKIAKKGFLWFQKCECKKHQVIFFGQKKNMKQLNFVQNGMSPTPWSSLRIQAFFVQRKWFTNVDTKAFNGHLTKCHWKPKPAHHMADDGLETNSHFLCGTIPFFHSSIVVSSFYLSYPVPPFRMMRPCVNCNWRTHIKNAIHISVKGIHTNRIDYMETSLYHGLLRRVPSFESDSLIILERSHKHVMSLTYLLLTISDR